eukprot:10029811-Lingulodinium_polyedra.AAC.1
MDCPWTVHGLVSIDWPWTTRELPLDCLGLAVGSPWTINGQCPRIAHALPTDLPWTMHGQCMDRSWT